MSNIYSKYFIIIKMIIFAKLNLTDVTIHI
jgi:hypothetical protein